jgi:signal transduction histidine kinase
MTLRSRLLLGNLAMVFVPLALVILLNAVLISFVQEGASGPAHHFPFPWESAAIPHHPLPTRQMLALTQTTLRQINVQTLRHPDKLTDPAFWAGLDDDLNGNDAGLAVRRNDTVVFASSDLGDWAALRGLPPYGSLEGSLPPNGPVGQRFRMLGQWDFPLSDGAQLSVFLLWITQPWNTAVATFSTVMLTGFFVSTLGVGLLLTWLIGRSLVRPLRRLQDASARIAADDLSPSPPYTPRDELAPLFGAFETMRGRLEENRHLRERYEADRRDMIAHIAHDLKTPVTAINGYVQGILDGVASTPEKRRQYLEVIGAKARELDRRTDELFFFSSLDLGTLPYEFQTFDLGEFLQNLWQDLTHEYGPQGLTGPRPQLPPGPLPVRGDPARLRRVFANLADNTVKFRRGDGVKWHWTLETSTKYRLSLVDDGVGIGEEALPHVFDRFYREDGSRTSLVPGTGLGLAIVKRIVEDHGGTVEASSGPGPGTTIVLELPQP